MALDYEPKKIVCVDCGDEFYLENYKDTETCRCKDCVKVHKRELKRLEMQRYRERKKML